MVSSSAVNDQANTIPNVFKGTETCMKILDEFGHLVSPSLADMSFIYDQHDFNMLVHIEQSLHKERVADLDFLTVVIFEPRTIVESHTLDHHLCGNSSLR